MHTVSFLREPFSTHMKFPSDIDKDYTHEIYAENKKNWVLLQAPTLPNLDWLFQVPDTYPACYLGNTFCLPCLASNVSLKNLNDNSFRVIKGLKSLSLALLIQHFLSKQLLTLFGSLSTVRGWPKQSRRCGDTECHLETKAFTLASHTQVFLSPLSP